jgi:uncharacterized phage protein gp47/JayE
VKLSFQDFPTTVQNMAAAVQGACSSLLDLTVGSPLRAALEAVASAALWLQWLIAQVYSMTRLATSVGADVDSFVADFGLTRLPAVSADGQVTVARYSTGNSALIPVGSSIVTLDGTQTFFFVADTTQAAWSASQNGYVIASSAESITATVEAATPGTGGNIAAGALGLFSTAVPFVDTVTNAAAFTNGVNAESDAALQARFANYIQTRAEGTVAAIEYAISTVQQGLTYQVFENTNAGGDWLPGNFLVVVDDGSGATPTATINAVTAAIEPVRPIGSTFTVQAATRTVATISLTITTSPTTNKPALVGPVATAITAFVNALPEGATLLYNRIATVAYGVDPSISDVSAVVLNSATADLSPGNYGVVRVGSVAVD